MHLVEIAKSLPTDWLKAKSEAARFEAFRSLPDAAKLDLLAYCVAMTLKPKLAPVAGDEVTAYDIALSLAEANVASLLASDEGELPGPRHPRRAAGPRPRCSRRRLGTVADQRQKDVAGRSTSAGIRRSR